MHIYLDIYNINITPDDIYIYVAFSPKKHRYNTESLQGHQLIAGRQHLRNTPFSYKKCGYIVNDIERDILLCTMDLCEFP